MKLSEKSRVNLDICGDVLTIRPDVDDTRMTDIQFFVCPVCGHVLYGTGKVELTCHGHHLEALVAQSAEGRWEYQVETVEDEYYVTVAHEMTKQNYIGFMAAVSADRVQLVKLYPEGPAEARFKKSGVRALYFYSKNEGLNKINGPLLTPPKGGR